MSDWELPKECRDCEHCREVYMLNCSYDGTYVCTRDVMAVKQVNPDDDACSKWELRDI